MKASPSTRFLVLLCAMVPALQAAPPPELYVLQEQYRHDVTLAFEKAKGELDAKFATALDAAAAKAQQEGVLDSVVALQGERKRLADGLPIPSVEEDGPEALRKLRIIYHSQLARLETGLETARAEILPAHTTKLQTLETILTKAGRIPEALEVKSYRESLTPAAAPGSAPATMTTTPSVPSPAPGPTGPVPNVQGNDRKAAEWVFANWKDPRLFIGGVAPVEKVADLPNGSFVITSLSLDGSLYTGATPVNGAMLFDNLGGLPGLKSIRLSDHLLLTDADLTFLATLDGLEDIRLHKMPRITDATMLHLTGLSRLKILKCSEIEGITGSNLVHMEKLPLESLEFWKSGLNDAGLAGIAKFRSLVTLSLNGHRKITDASLPIIRELPSLENLYIADTGISPQGIGAAPLSRIKLLSSNSLCGLAMKDIIPLVAPAFPNVVSYQHSYDAKTPEDLAALAHFKKLEAIGNYGRIFDAAWPGLLELRGLRRFAQKTATPLPDTALPLLAQLKKLEILYTGDLPPSATVLATLRETRPDLKIEQ